jgi:hypothetical protein
MARPYRRRRNLAADRPDQLFGKGVLPGRRTSDRLVSYAHGAWSMRNGGALPIADEIAWEPRCREKLWRSGAQSSLLSDVR